MIALSARLLARLASSIAVLATALLDLSNPRGRPRAEFRSTLKTNAAGNRPVPPGPPSRAVRPRPRAMPRSTRRQASPSGGCGTRKSMSALFRCCLHRNRLEEVAMLGWALSFLVIALIAAVLGFGGIAGVAIEIAKIIFVVAIILFVISVIF